MTITGIFSLILPLANIYFLWRINKNMEEVAADSQRRQELNDSIKKFGLMFAAAADVPKPAPTSHFRKLKIETAE